MSPRLALLLAALAGAVFLLPRAAPAEVIDRVVATVNGEAITLYELYKAEIPIFGRILASGDLEIASPEDHAKERELLEKIVEERLLLQRAKERGIAVPSEEVSEAIERIRQEKNVSEENFAAAISQRGLTMADYRDRITKQMVISRLYHTEVRSKIFINPEEITEYYRRHLLEYTVPERVKIRHLLTLKKAEDTPEQALARANMVAALIAGGADFEETARQYSEDSSTQKGEISGYIQRGDALPKLEKAIFDLEQGQTSGVIESPAGYHIIKVEVKEPSQTKSIEEVSAEISTLLMEEKMAGRYEDWLKEIKKQAAVSIKL